LVNGPRSYREVLSAEEVEALLTCVRSLKHRTLMLTLYAAGPEAQRGIFVGIPDIDSKRMLLKIRNGKGRRIA
jgi:integrase/recombinase XerD